MNSIGSTIKSNILIKYNCQSDDVKLEHSYRTGRQRNYQRQVSLICILSRIYVLKNAHDSRPPYKQITNALKSILVECIIS